jgi:hypothetical protein
MRASLLAAAACACVLGVCPAEAHSKPYTPKNGILNWRAILLGGAFRVTPAIPLHGDFSRFGRIEIVQARSLIGPDAPPSFLQHLTQQLANEFRKAGRFGAVTIVEAYDPAATAAAVASGGAAAQPVFRRADPVDAPLRSGADMAEMDRERAAAAGAPPLATLVVTSNVIDYAKGNKFAQLLFLNLGNAVVTLRLSYYDKATGEELGRSVISSDNSSKVVPSLVSPRSALTGVVEGLVDQVTRRQVAAEQ